MSDLVHIRNLSKEFKNQKALDQINASIPKGAFAALAGPDGAGKTTLIRLMAGLLLPTAGEIVIDGLDTVKNQDELHKRIGYMPQRFGLYEDLTVIQNLTLYADLQGVVGPERKETFKKLLGMMNLAPFQDRLAGALSGGMKQKLGLACTLIRKPTLLLLDEPSVGVDPVSRRELWSMMQEFLAEGITVVWSTSYLDEAEKADITLLLNEGKLLYCGPPAHLTEKVQGKTFKIQNISGSRRNFLMNLLNQKNVEDGVIQGSSVRVVATEPDPSWTPCPPRFEDAFIDILGGGPGGRSELAEKTPPIASKESIEVEAKDLTRKFGSFTAVDHVTFQVTRGEVFGLLGPNGAGKSTTFKMLCGLLKPTSGHAYVGGRSLETAPSEARSHIGYMAQKFSLYGGLSVQQNLEFFSGIYNLTGSNRSKTIEEMIEIFGFAPYLNESASQLPLGFKQRLALACSVMHRPEVLFLDEPTSGVDPITRREFWNHINGLVEKGCTVIVTTHFMDEAEYCDRIGLIYQSRLIHIGTPDSLKELAKTPEQPTPTLEDAFVYLIQNFDQKKGLQK
ncbi:MAG: ABC transporter ATP-binding protein [Verrucomicrobia bacterium]|nr:ABC transporter ATP-binding protein [Verrucomicrobiota bacterium]